MTDLQFGHDRFGDGLEPIFRSQPISRLVTTDFLVATDLRSGHDQFFGSKTDFSVTQFGRDRKIGSRNLFKTEKLVVTCLRIGRDRFFGLEPISRSVVTEISVATDHRIGRDRYFGLEPIFRSRPILLEHTSISVCHQTPQNAP